MGVQQYASTDTALQAYRYAQAFVAELAQRGVAHACICPGSRSTPLTLAFAHEPRIRSWEHVDERSAAFFALGMAKALRAPVAVVCTSGTAAANFMPAVVEAYYSRVPLLVLTADRPHELRDTGALQSIDQVKLYGSKVKWFVDMAIAGEDFDAETYARSIARRAAIASTRAPAGPVHINFPFREPLVPSRQEPPAEADAPAARGAGIQGTRLPADGIERLAGVFSSRGRGVIVCGPQDDPEFAGAIVDMALALGYPVLADPLSQLRTGAHDFRPVVDNYDVFLRHGRTAQALRPEIVIRFGLTPTSKPLLGFLAGLDGAEQYLVDAGGGWIDPLRVAGEMIEADPTSFARDIAGAVRAGRVAWDVEPVRDASAGGPWNEGVGSVAEAAMRSGSGDPGDGGTWLSAWRAASTCARMTVAADLAVETALSEPKVFEQLGERLPAGSLLYVGNSMPVRDLDDFFGSREKAVRILGNRGVNGIDGVVSSALGAGAALGSRVVLVIGDLSFYHDMNGLLAAKLHGLDATIILVNNDGGGIFSFLPQAEHPETFERFFGTPTGLDFEPAVEMYGGRFYRPHDWAEFHRSLDDCMGEPGLSVVEVRTDRAENARRHAEIWDSVKSALDHLSPHPQE